MMNKHYIKLFSGIGLFILIVTMGSFSSISWGAVATSSSYQLEFDSINFAGLHSTSTNYSLEDTAGEVATGWGTSNSYKLHAGYQQSESYSMSISSPADVTLLPAINGLLGGTATGTATWTVTTNNPNGYSLSIKAESDPALTGASDSFDDYTPGGAVPDYTWSVVASDAEFGFSPEGSDVVSRYLDDGSDCGTGILNTNDICWDGFSTNGVNISTSSTANDPGGTDTTIEFQAEAGASSAKSSGSYSAVITVTALSL